MLIASVELKFGGVVVEPGMEIPDNPKMAPHILQAHINRRSILDVDEKRATEVAQLLKTESRQIERQLASGAEHR